APISLTGNARADAVAIPVGEILGWLVAAGAGELGDDVAPSARWLGGVAIWAVDLTSRGAMVPLLRRRTRRSGRGDDAVGSYSVRWTPALVAPDRLARTAQTMPGSVRAADRKIERTALTRSVLTGVVDAICRQSARRVDAAAAPPRVRTANDVAEAFPARRDGGACDAPVGVATPIVTRIEQWARAVTGSHEPLVVRLDPPEGENAWHLEVFATQRGSLVPIEQAIVMPGSERQHLELDLARLERMVPALTRPGGMRRGQVILSADEAWTLMAETGPRLAVAGYDVRIPELSPRRSRPSLRVFVENAETAVGVNQLANVRWTALFDDV